MTIKAIAKICKSHKEVVRYMDEGGNHWIGFNGALYLVPTLPDCDNAQLAAIFDIPPEKVEKMNFEFFRCPDEKLFNDIYKAENLVERGKVNYIIDGIEFEPIKTSNGLVLINTEYLAPFKKLKNGIELYERLLPENRMLIAVKSGFELHGILGFHTVPSKFIEYQKEIIKYADITAEDNTQLTMEFVQTGGDEK